MVQWKPLNKRHIGIMSIVPYNKEVVLISEGPLLEVPLYSLLCPPLGILIGGGGLISQ